jgi:hypothetical protein
MSLRSYGSSIWKYVVSENIILVTPASLSQQLKPNNCLWISNDRYHMAGLVRERSFGSSTFGCNLGKGDVLIHHVKLVVVGNPLDTLLFCSRVYFKRNFNYCFYRQIARAKLWSPLLCGIIEILLEKKFTEKRHRKASCFPPGLHLHYDRLPICCLHLHWPSAHLLSTSTLWPFALLLSTSTLWPSALLLSTSELTLAFLPLHFIFLPLFSRPQSTVKQ